MPDEPPRRMDPARMTPAETAIAACIREVEALGSDPRLTDAVAALWQARHKVGDFVDDVERWK